MTIINATKLAMESLNRQIALGAIRSPKYGQTVSVREARTETLERISHNTLARGKLAFEAVVSAGQTPVSAPGELYNPKAGLLGKRPTKQPKRSVFIVSSDVPPTFADSEGSRIDTREVTYIAYEDGVDDEGLSTKVPVRVDTGVTIVSVIDSDECAGIALYRIVGSEAAGGDVHAGEDYSAAQLANARNKFAQARVNFTAARINAVFTQSQTIAESLGGHARTSVDKKLASAIKREMKDGASREDILAKYTDENPAELEVIFSRHVQSVAQAAKEVPAS